jgi:hypothetical protein
VYHYPYELIIINYGVKIDKVSRIDQNLICFYILNSMHLDVIGDNCLVSRFQVEPIIACRMIVGKEYKTSVTLSLIGCHDELIGVRATIFNPELCIEKGVLLILEGDFYKNKIIAPVAIKKKKYMAMDKLYLITSNDTQLNNILEDQKGWKTIFTNLKVTISSSEYNLILFDRMSDMTVIDSLENILLHYS